MTESCEGYIRCLHVGGTHRVAWRRWEPRGRRKAEVFCVHGMGRNSRDFIPLANDLASKGFAVTAPDLVGFGRSDYLSHVSWYHPNQYLTDCHQLIMEALRMDTPTAVIRANWRSMARVLSFTNPFIGPVVDSFVPKMRHDVPVIWIGTSMGGLIGMNMAAQSRSPIDALILNDVGPEIPARFMRYVRALGKTTDGRFDSIDEVKAYLQRYAPGFGPMSDTEWSLLASNSVVNEHGYYRFDFDPQLSTAAHNMPTQAVEMWDVWNAIQCPVKVLKGECSQVLLDSSANRMRNKAEITVLPDAGHAPPLYSREQRNIIFNWVNSLATSLSVNGGLPQPRGRIEKRCEPAYS